MEERKKFRDTKVGVWLKQKSPAILETVGDLLPDDGVLGIVKNLIDKSTMSSDDKKYAHEQLKELYALEVADRESARNREIEVSKTRSFDFLFNLTGVIGLGTFLFIIYVIVYIQVPEENKEIWIHLIGICEGVVLSIFGYYFGSAVKRNQ
jgi:hypothetical protein